MARVTTDPNNQAHASFLYGAILDPDEHVRQVIDDRIQSPVDPP